MSRSDDIVGYTYKADLYCPECVLDAMGLGPGKAHIAALGTNVEQELDNAAADYEIDRHDESSFDSGEFPKVVFRDMIDGHMGFGKLYDDNAPLERCGSCGEVLGE